MELIKQGSYRGFIFRFYPGPLTTKGDRTVHGAGIQVGVSQFCCHPAADRGFTTTGWPVNGHNSQPGTTTRLLRHRKAPADTLSRR